MRVVTVFGGGADCVWTLNRPSSMTRRPESSKHFAARRTPVRSILISLAIRYQVNLVLARCQPRVLRKVQQTIRHCPPDSRDLISASRNSDGTGVNGLSIECPPVSIGPFGGKVHHFRRASKYAEPSICRCRIDVQAGVR